MFPPGVSDVGTLPDQRAAEDVPFRDPPGLR